MLRGRHIFLFQPKILVMDFLVPASWSQKSNQSLFTVCGRDSDKMYRGN